MADVSNTFPNPQNLPAAESDAPKFDWQTSELSEAENEKLREMELRAQEEAGEDGFRVPTELVFLMMAPILMIALPLLLFLTLRGTGTAGHPPSSTVPVASVVNPSTSTSGLAPAWNSDFEAAQQLARQSGKNLLVDFYSDTCGACMWMDANVFTDPAVVQESQNVVMVKINATQTPELAERYNIDGFPTFVWMDSSGIERGRQLGALPAAEFVPMMQRYR